MRSRKRRKKQMKGNIVHSLLFLLHDLTIRGRRDGEKETNDVDRTDLLLLSLLGTSSILSFLLSKSSSILSFLLPKSSSIPFNRFERIQMDGIKTERNTLFTFLFLPLSLFSSSIFLSPNLSLLLSEKESFFHFFFLVLYSDTRIGSNRNFQHIRQFAAELNDALLVYI